MKEEIKSEIILRKESKEKKNRRAKAEYIFKFLKQLSDEQVRELERFICGI